MQAKYLMLWWRREGGAAGAVGTVRYVVQGLRLASTLVEQWPESVSCVSALCFLLNPTLVVLRWEELSQDFDLLREGELCSARGSPGAPVPDW